MSRWSPDPPPKPQETIYDFLRSLCGRVPWRDEEERRKWEAWVAEIERVNIFGYMATKITTNMSEDER